MLQRTGRVWGEALDAPDATAALTAPAAAPLRNFAKDLDFVLQAAAGSGLLLPATAAARADQARGDVRRRAAAVPEQVRAPRFRGRPG